MLDLYSQRQNHLLAGLRPADYQRLSAHLEVIHLPQGKILCEAGALIHYVYFPTTAIISSLFVMQDGSCAETGIIGNEGMVGVSVFMGAENTSNRVVVQNAGYACRLSKQILKQEFDRSSAVREVMLRYIQALITHLAQTAVCNRHHSVDQQLARWLLLNLDRSPTNVLTATHELIANTLGVRPEYLLDAINKLRNARVINYEAGIIVVLDRSGLEQRSCECYGVVKNEFNRLLLAAA